MENEKVKVLGELWMIKALKGSFQLVLIILVLGKCSSYQDKSRASKNQTFFGGHLEPADQNLNKTILFP